MPTTYAELKLLTSDTELEIIQGLARRDEHLVLAPTHVVMKDKSIAGYFSVGSLPIWHAHLRKGIVEPHDTYNLIHTVENLMQLKGAKYVITPVGHESPIHSRMESKGYKKIATVDLFIKEF